MNHIVGYPRSGATQFAIDYAKKHGFIWRGELNTKMISTNGNQSQMKRLIFKLSIKEALKEAL